MRKLHLIHRWLGIALGLLVLAWLVSGLVMLFVARPKLQEDERLQGLRALPATQGLLSPGQAWAGLGLSEPPKALRLQNQAQGPVYLFQLGKQWQAVDARSGQVRGPVGAEFALAQACDFAGAGAGEGRAQALNLDQWTVYGSFNAQRPFYRVEFDDAAGLELYVAQASGEVVLDTDGTERALNWVGSVLHWLYFTPLRQQGALWGQVVVWSSGVAAAMVLLGMVLGVQRLRLRRRYAGGRITPYRAQTHAWQRWHHLGGLAAGIVLLVWLLSGWLSMRPFGLLDGKSDPAGLKAEQLAFGGGPLMPGRLSLPGLPAGSAWKELEALRFDGRDYWLAKSPQRVLLLDAGGQVLPQGLGEAELQSLAPKLKPAHRIASAGWLHEPDLHYYPHRHSNRVLPVYRVIFDDAQRTAFYIDPQRARLAQRVDESSRNYRWLFNAAHRLDFPPLSALGLPRDALVIALTLLCSGVSLAGVVLGWRRLGTRKART